MKRTTLAAALDAACATARTAGTLIRRHLRAAKRVNLATQHDIKLELDVRSQRLIERALRRALPEAAILGEEESQGDLDSPLRWVVDPIDGTVNFAYGIPHACVSIALQERVEPGTAPTAEAYADGYRSVVGVVYDPFTDELWTADISGPARLNGRRIQAAERSRLDEAIVALGFAKTKASLERMMPLFQDLTHRVRKIRITGSAALCTTYVATGRFDAYIEGGVRLWDIAAGGLIVQQAGGVFWRRELDREERRFEIRVSGAKLQRAIERVHARVQQ